MLGPERGRLAVSLDMLTDALILIGQHGVYCVSNRNPTKPALDLQAVLDQINGAKQLIQSTMAELERKRDLAAKPGAPSTNAGQGCTDANSHSRVPRSSDVRDQG